VVSIAGMAAVRDSDFQANLERYLSEEILTTMLDPEVTDYPSVTRQAIWYFTRIIVCVQPAVVRWWPTRAAADGPPAEWRAPEGTVWPRSDPAPAGSQSESPWRPAPDWRELAQGALARKAAAHLTLLDRDGFPLPIRARRADLTAEGFSLAMPGWLPWSGGRATLTFEGIETFIGAARIEEGEAHFTAERALPVHPLMAAPEEILHPRPETKATLLRRIETELERRGLPLPNMPDHAPAPTAGARLRAEAAFSFAGFGDAEG
jgi:hypothetical protein